MSSCTALWVNAMLPGKWTSISWLCGASLCTKQCMEWWCTHALSQSILTCQVAAGSSWHIGKVQRFKYKDERKEVNKTPWNLHLFFLTSTFWFQKQYVTHNYPCQHRFIKCREYIWGTMEILLFCQSTWYWFARRKYL